MSQVAFCVMTSLAKIDSLGAESLLAKTPIQRNNTVSIDSAFCKDSGQPIFLEIIYGAAIRRTPLAHRWLSVLKPHADSFSRTTVLKPTTVLNTKQRFPKFSSSRCDDENTGNTRTYHSHATVSQCGLDPNWEWSVSNFVSH